MRTISLINTTPWCAAHRRIESPSTIPRFILNSTKPYPFNSNSFSVNNNNNSNAASSSSYSSSSSSSTESDRLSADTLSRVASARDADEALQVIITSQSDYKPGCFTTSDCGSIISAAFARGNPDLAISIFYGMMASVPQGVIYCSCFCLL